MTVIYELARQHANAGGATTVVIMEGAADGYPPYPVGALVEANLGHLPVRRDKAFDALRGAVGLQRRAVVSTYSGVLATIPVHFDGHVIVHNAPGVTTWLARARPGVRVSLFAHNALFKTYTRREARRLVDASHCVICVSGFLAEDLRRRIGRDDERIRVVRNGVDVETFSPGVARPTPDTPTILFLGRVVPDKGVDILARAALLLQERGVPFRLRIVGSRGFSAHEPLSRYEANVRELLRQLGDQVAFLPFQERSRVPSIFREADVYCLPSRMLEGLPLGMLEAMSTGLATIATTRGGSREAGRDAALYFDPPDHKALAELLESVLTDHHELRRRGELARREAERSTWECSYLSLADALSRSIHPPVVVSHH